VTINSTPVSTLPAVSRFANFSTTITFTASSEGVDPVTFEPITIAGSVFSANCVKNFVDNEILIANGSSSVTISGRHTTAFASDEVKYVERGSSDILQTPVIVYNFVDVPPDKDIYEANQDPSNGVTRTYTVEVNSSEGPATFTFTQMVLNDVTVAYNFLRDYY